MNQPSAFGGKKDSQMKHNSSVAPEKFNANGQTHLSLNKKSSFFTDKNTADTNINTISQQELIGSSPNSKVKLRGPNQNFKCLNEDDLY